jgi:hypothetical protein
MVMATTSFLINEFTGTDAQVMVTLTDQGTDTVQVKLDVVSSTTGNIADLIGFFVNFKDSFTVTEALNIGIVSATPGTLTSTSETSNGSQVLFLDDSGSTVDNTTDVDSNVNLNGQGDQREFELGVQFGQGGLVGGSDDFRSVTFSLSAAGLDISDFEKVGVRLQAVGPAGGRDGSSKLEGDVPTFQPFSIAGTKYLDQTGNEITADDIGLGGVTIFIDKNGNGANDDGLSTVTADDGSWLFSNLGADLLNKKVFEVVPDGYVQTVGTLGYALPSSGGQNLTGLNFANFKLFNISGTKYFDKTGNGVSGDDTGLAGITIFIDKNGNGANDDGLTTTTGADGTWSFSNLSFDLLGKTVLEQLPSGYVQTAGNAGYVLPSVGGQDQTGLNFANFKLFNISGTKYFDKTGDGITGDDTGLGGVTIFIDQNSSGTFDVGETNTVTAADGSWSFSNLSFDMLGKKVFELVPGGYIQTVGNAGYVLPSEGGQDLTRLNFANFKPSGPGVGTPGYWGNRNGTTAWNTITSQSANFVDDPVVAGTTKVSGAILVGDFNRNGLTDAGESTIFYTNAEARAILGSATEGQDARYILGRQLVAAWMNVLAGNTYDTGFASIKQDIANGVVWLKNATPNEGGDAAGDGSLTVAGSTRLPSSDSRWSTALANPANGAGRYYGESIKNVLDYYNNTGAGFAIDRDTSLVGGSLSQLGSLQAYRPYF